MNSRTPTNGSTEIRGEIRRNESLSHHTTWKVGGSANTFFIPDDVADLAAYLVAMPAQEPLLWLGRGSNLLVRDGGFPGTVIQTTGITDLIKLSVPETVRAGAGATSVKFARFCADHGLGGSEFLSTIPGTLGGALAMNAGAFGGDTWSLVRQVETLDRKGMRRTRDASDFVVGYRQVVSPRDEWFVSAEFQLTATDQESIRAKMRVQSQQRDETQPVADGRSCGSVFKNPCGEQPGGGGASGMTKTAGNTAYFPCGESAGALIERCGLKGATIGGAVVSDRHGNFILNRGNAAAADIEALINHILAVVMQETGIRLDLEVRIVGVV